MILTNSKEEEEGFWFNSNRLKIIKINILVSFQQTEITIRILFHNKKTQIKKN